MLAKSFFEELFFMSGAQGIILFVVCIAAALGTLAAIAMSIVTATVLKRRKAAAARKREEITKTVPPKA